MDRGSGENHIMVFLAAVKPANMVFLRVNLTSSLRAEIKHLLKLSLDIVKIPSFSVLT